MSLDNPFFGSPIVLALFWPAATIGFYLCARKIYARWPRWYLSPLAVTPALLLALAVLLGARYVDYMRGAHWIMLALGPATVAFAIPIYEKRETIRRNWRVLLLGVLIGSGTAMASAWAMASALGLSGDLRLSLLPRSMSTPFAMEVSGDIGGAPDLTAIFVMVTGIFGAALGELMLTLLPLRSSLARGALLGMGAHGAGAAKAREIGQEEGSIAGLVMVLAGLLNVLAAPILAYGLKGGF
ncbi:LrgB family protein [Methylocella silvestris BL2]|uniref:LrgB family protein n=1 Tax=Methylocella silvestris (strain DSM 15510 / CIP 108128 / LMG 27833 / NCIMB 13906 / BL2) TaxID=395965 RepID=B8EMJ9_METSB|nr:LrgB family protein [Methylocella silvestris]ACK52678.1 LrgB family protein [Methylocella silvestris BL2]